MTSSRDSPPLQYHRAPYQPTMGAPTPQETLAVQLRSANSKVSKTTNERKAAAKRAAQQVGFVDPSVPLMTCISAHGKKTSRDLTRIYWSYIVRLVFLLFFMWIID